MRLVIQPITLRAASVFVQKFHRHHKKVQGHKFAVGLYDQENGLLGVAICGRPVSRKLDNGLILEVNRLCVKDGIKNGCSKLYGACARIAKEMGYNKIITYILESEIGISLKAAGWELCNDKAGGESWNSSGNIKRTAEINTLFGAEKKYPQELKKRYEKRLMSS